MRSWLRRLGSASHPQPILIRKSLPTECPRPGQQYLPIEGIFHCTIPPRSSAGPSVGDAAGQVPAKGGRTLRNRPSAKPPRGLQWSCLLLTETTRAGPRCFRWDHATYIAEYWAGARARDRRMAASSYTKSRSTRLGKRLDALEPPCRRPRPRELGRTSAGPDTLWARCATLKGDQSSREYVARASAVPVRPSDACDAQPGRQTDTSAHMRLSRKGLSISAASMRIVSRPNAHIADPFDRCRR